MWFAAESCPLVLNACDSMLRRSPTSASRLANRSFRNSPAFPRGIPFRFGGRFGGDGGVSAAGAAFSTAFFAVFSGAAFLTTFSGADFFATAFFATFLDAAFFVAAAFFAGFLATFFAGFLATFFAGFRAAGFFAALRGEAFRFATAFFFAVGFFFAVDFFEAAFFATFFPDAAFFAAAFLVGFFLVGFFSERAFDFAEPDAFDARFRAEAPLRETFFDAFFFAMENDRPALRMGRISPKIVAHYRLVHCEFKTNRPTR